MRLQTLVFAIISFLFTSGTVHSGGSAWPGMPYHHVKVYLYNLDGKLFGRHSPIKEGIPDPTLFGEGVTLNTESQNALNKWLRQDLSLLNEGMAGCYIPHHAIIFYDDQNKPIAWMSACFMCTGIRFYFPVPKMKKVVYNSKTEQMANRQIADLRKIVEGAGIPVFDTAEEYGKYMQKNKKVSNERVCLDTAFIRNYYPEKLTMDVLMKSISADSIDAKFSTTHHAKVTAGGDAYSFYECRYKTSRFWFSGRKGGPAYLDHAVILNEEVRLLQQIAVGIQEKQIYSMITCEGHPYPSSLVLHNGAGKAIRFSLYNGEISGIELLSDY
ncbi:MAG TPA: hypothetical protein PK637_08315 [Flavobacteriales bacterium]|nr:hypothetical protein [Flavobacteriales bacterium]HRE96755.1 hypothetical protein [Flavobacteriales bacterium]HRJ37748.1 hypothetical protein [Flavobacteriales bacterium]